MKCKAAPLGKFGRDYMKYAGCHMCKDADACRKEEECKEEKSMSDLVKDIKYVIVEMIENNQEKAVSDSIRTGLFQGIRSHKSSDKDNDALVILESKEKVLYLLNLRYYNILSLKKSDGSSKIATYFRASPDDQSKAFNMITDIMTGMHAAERTDKNDCTLINLETYSDLPDDFTSIKTDIKAGGGSTISRSSVYTPKTISPIKKTVKPVITKNEIKPQFFKRGSKKLSEADLKEMEKKIEEIASGKLKVELPVVDNDGEVGVGVDEDDYYDAQYMYCAG